MMKIAVRVSSEFGFEKIKQRRDKTMSNWDKKYIVTELRSEVGDAPWTPTFGEKEGCRLLSLDSKVIPGAFYMETAWFWPGNWPAYKGEAGVVKEHSHEFAEAIAFVGTNPEDINDLGGEVELWIDGKQNIMDRSFLAFIPAGTKHCPLTIRRVDRPIFHFTAGMRGSYV
jgi:hypothetical protein